jgi:hypothetical protein
MTNCRHYDSGNCKLAKGITAMQCPYRLEKRKKCLNYKREVKKNDNR